jgi:predicted ArsR family transcriptional regulator
MIREAIMLALRAGPMTRDEAARAAGVAPSQAWRRLCELHDAGLIETVGIRPGDAGRAQSVYQLTQAGWRWLGKEASR